MITDIQFTEYINNSIGKKERFEYGFVKGDELTTLEGLSGFSVWKAQIQEDDSRLYEEKYFINEGVNKNLTNIIEFLKNN